MARVLVVGAGIGGLTAAILLGRAGHEVILCERDPAPLPHDPDAMWSDWPRPGTPQARLGHTFLAGTRRLLCERLPDVLAAVLEAGAQEWDVAAGMPGGDRRERDAELVSIMARRPVFEGLLRRAAQAEPAVQLRRGCCATGLVADPARDGRPVRIRGVTVRGADPIVADVVVLAGGRALPIGRWLAAAGAGAPREEAEACGFACYTRYFRLRARPGADAGATSQLTFHRDAGYAVAEMIGADRGTFVAELIVPTRDAAFRRLRDPRAWMAAAGSVEEWREWLDPERSTPITPGVEVMGQERNVYRRFVDGGCPIAVGLHAIGDARCQTDSLFAWGCANAIAGAAALADVVAAHPGDLAAQALDLDERIDAELRARFRYACERDRAWHGTRPADRSPGDARRGAALVDELLYPAASRDPEIFRAVTRWELQLDPADGLERNTPLVERALRRAEQRPVPSAQDAFPSRDELLAAIATAA